MQAGRDPTCALYQNNLTVLCQRWTSVATILNQASRPHEHAALVNLIQSTIVLCAEEDREKARDLLTTGLLELDNMVVCGRVDEMRNVFQRRI